MSIFNVDSDEHLVIEKRNHCLVMIFNRAKKYNAFSPEMYHKLAKAYYQIQHDTSIRSGLLVALGDNFSAGLELEKWAPIFASGKPPELADDEIDPFGVTGERLTKPVVIAVQGICFTVGLELLLNTDIRLATAETRFAQLEVKRGIFPCGGATVRLQQQIGWGNAQRYLMTGDEFTGDDAYRMGLVQEIESIEGLHQSAWDLVEKIGKVAPLGVQASLTSSRVAHLESENKALSELYTLLEPVAKSDDAKEGVQSFLERREANFKGS